MVLNYEITGATGLRSSSSSTDENRMIKLGATAKVLRTAPTDQTVNAGIALSFNDKTIYTAILPQLIKEANYTKVLINFNTHTIHADWTLRVIFW